MTDSRLISFLRRTLAFKGKALALTAGVIFGAMALLVALNTDTEKKHYPNPEITLAAANNSDTIQVARTMPDPNWGMEINITIFMLIITGAVAGAKFYSDFSSKQRRLEALTLPVSASTRFWSSFIIYTAGTWCVILPSLFIIDACRVLILRSWYDLGEMARFLPFLTCSHLFQIPLLWQKGQDAVHKAISIQVFAERNRSNTLNDYDCMSQSFHLPQIQ